MTPTYDVGSGSLGYVYTFTPGPRLIPSVGIAGSLDVLDRRVAELQGGGMNPGALLYLRGIVR